MSHTTAHGRCLFTGEVLGPDTALEHSPPRALGGRFRSDRSISSAFNHAAGASLDAFLVESWRLVLTLLAPAMTSESRPTAGAPMKVPGSDLPYVLLPGGELRLAGPQVLERAAPRIAGKPGRPTKVIGPIGAQLENFARQCGIRGPTQIAPIDLPEHMLDEGLCRTIGPECEAAALKSILVAFDIVHGSAPGSWVRGEHTALARDWIQQAALQQTVAVAPYREMAWGRDPLLVPRLRHLGNGKALGGPMGALDHVFVACGDGPYRTLDVAWLVFGHEPYAFRLSTDYRGPQFCEVVRSSPLRDGPTQHDLQFPWPFVLPGERGLMVYAPNGSPYARPLQPYAEAAAQLWFDAVNHAALIGEIDDRAPTPNALFEWAHREWLKGGIAFETAHAVVVDYVASMYETRGLKLRAVLAAEADRLAPELREATVTFLETPSDSLVADWAIDASPACRALLRIVSDAHGPPVRIVNPRIEIEMVDAPQ